MKILDRFLRRWRVKVALKNLPEPMENIYDIGCDDGFLLSKFVNISGRKDGCDPNLSGNLINSESNLIKGYFPSVVQRDQLNGIYDAIFALAVFEHFAECDICESSVIISKMLSPRGRLIITVPHPFVDKILDVLLFFHLIDGQALDEHHGFDPNTLVNLFSKNLKLIKSEKFQFGLNNIFVFQRH